MATKPPKPTLQELHASGLLTTRECLQFEMVILRLIQIQEEQKTLEAERGFRDSKGIRQPGLSDELERLLITHDLTATGFKWNGYSIIMMPGGNSYIDPALLLAEGIDPDVINRCTVTTSWVSPQVRKDPTKK